MDSSQHLTEIDGHVLEPAAGQPQETNDCGPTPATDARTSTPSDNRTLLDSERFVCFAGCRSHAIERSKSHSN